MSFIPGNAGSPARAPDGMSGVSNGSAAAVGVIGEYLSAGFNQGASQPLTSSATLTIGSVALTAGDWDLSAGANFLQSSGGALTTSALEIAINTSATFPSTSFYGDSRWGNPAGPNLSSNAFLVMPNYRVSISTLTTYYFVCFAVFSGSTMSVSGKVTARRVR